jgi:hypothetical protein
MEQERSRVCFVEAKYTHSVFQETGVEQSAFQRDRTNRRNTLCSVDIGEEHTVFLEKEGSKHGHTDFEHMERRRSCVPLK